MLVSDGRIYRFLHKPVSPARANLFLSAASRRYHELRNVEPVHLTTVQTIAARPNLSLLVVSIVVLLIVGIGAAIWYLNRKEPAAVAPLPRAVGTLTQEEQITESLARGQMAIATDRLTDPRGNNAVEHFRAVLALQPDNADARTGLEAVGARLEARVVEALQAHDPARGATCAHGPATRGSRVSPTRRATSRTCGALAQHARTGQRRAAACAGETTGRTGVRTGTRDRRSQAPTARAGATAAAAAPSQPSASELESVARLRGRGILLEPPGNNAYEQLLALRAKYPASNELRIEQQQLAFAFLERTRTALAAGDVETARAFLSRVDTLVPNLDATKSLQTQLAAAQQQRNFASQIVQAKTLKRVREVPPSYPREAERLGLSGWVDVEFTIAPNGTTQDLVVRNAQPLRTFDEAAVDAVKRWRFEPVMRDGAAVPQRAAVRIRFELK